MLFNSIGFAVFLPIVLGLYWFVTRKSLRAQNILLLVSSYFFYSCWDWRFLFLLVFSTLLDYFSAFKIADASSQSKRKMWLFISTGINLGFLGVFKYYNFFAASFAESVAHLGIQVSPWTLQVILPVGISFYTFHGLSYVIDIYYDRIKPEKDFVDYSVFVSFFPLLVAGPIERATHLLPQIKKPRQFDYSKAVDGLRQILWGLFKKVVIADGCAHYANLIFNNSETYHGATLVLGALFFTFQIYGDFSGYSDIALGTARLFGIELLRNFAFPYFSRSIAEFWRRWHISLSTWFRDYLYIPLGGSKGGTWVKVRNTFIIFIVSGFWHGANWTFIVWGLLNALFIMPSIIQSTNRNHLDMAGGGRLLPSFKEALAIAVTFSLTVFAWIFFRAESLTHALHYVAAMLTGLLHKAYYIEMLNMLIWKIGAALPLLVLFFVAVEWMGRTQQYAIAALGLNWPRGIRWAAYYMLIVLVIYYSGSGEKFIYFQF